MLLAKFFFVIITKSDQAILDSASDSSSSDEAVYEAAIENLNHHFSQLKLAITHFDKLWFDELDEVTKNGLKDVTKALDIARRAHKKNIASEDQVSSGSNHHRPSRVEKSADEARGKNSAGVFF